MPHVLKTRFVKIFNRNRVNSKFIKRKYVIKSYSSEGKVIKLRVDDEKSSQLLFSPTYYLIYTVNLGFYSPSE